MHQNMEEHIEIDFPPMEKGEVKKAEWTRLLQNSGNKTRKFRRKKISIHHLLFLKNSSITKTLTMFVKQLLKKNLNIFFCSPPPPRDPGSADYINIYYLFLSRYDIYPTQTKKKLWKKCLQVALFFTCFLIFPCTYYNVLKFWVNIFQINK